MTSQRTAILGAVRTQLQGIIAGATVAAGYPDVYRSTVKTVSLVPRSWTPTQIPADSTPFIAVQSGEDRVEDLPGNMQWRNWQLLISCFVDNPSANPDEISRLSPLDDLETDVQAALCMWSNTTLGGNAVRTKVIAVDRDDLAETNQGAVRLLVETRYYRSLGTGA